MKFCFQNMGNGREDINKRRWTAFGFDNEKKCRSVFIFSIISQILKTKFYVFLVYR